MPAPDVFTECTRAYQRSSQQYIDARGKGDREKWIEVSDEVAKALIGVGCTLIAKTRDLGPDAAIAATEACLKQLTE